MASIDRRPNGKWRARWREYPGGPQRARHFTRKLDAERFLVEVQHRLLTGAYIAPEAARVTFDAYSRQYIERQPWRAWPGDEDRIRQAVDQAVALAGEDRLRTDRAAT